MKNNYNITTSLSCIVCGGKDFDFNDDKTYVKCNRCNREYLGGYDELVRLNSENINKAVGKVRDEIAKDFRDDILKAFKGNKNIKFK